MSILTSTSSAEGLTEAGLEEPDGIRTTNADGSVAGHQHGLRDSCGLVERTPAAAASAAFSIWLRCSSAVLTSMARPDANQWHHQQGCHHAEIAGSIPQKLFKSIVAPTRRARLGTRCIMPRKWRTSARTCRCLKGSRHQMLKAMHKIVSMPHFNPVRKTSGGQSGAFMS